jgi:hypothetical protein
MRSHRCHNALSDGKRHSPFTQIGHEFGGGGRAQESLLARCRVVKQSAILGDDPVEQMETRKYLAQAGKFAASDQYQLSPRLPSPFQPCQGVPADPPIAGQSPIVIRGYCQKSHRFSVPTIINGDGVATLAGLPDRRGCPPRRWTNAPDKLLVRATALSEEEAACH